ncbi:hypothetical protein PIB30_046067 [Stylosanthes scabra]|uniref:Uncharacterized protein n=1 Tax=Stylosanthes scabra TaxID=79078 RepID=A0ABU6TG46_9FABA|nr:hypothetical protein [Stylosanthes scabra]
MWARGARSTQVARTSDLCEQYIGLNISAGQGGIQGRLLEGIDPTRREGTDPTCSSRKRYDTIPPSRRNRDVLPCTTPKPQDVHFSTIATTGILVPNTQVWECRSVLQVLPPACFIGDSSIGLIATAQAWSKLG